MKNLTKNLTSKFIRRVIRKLETAVIVFAVTALPAMTSFAASSGDAANNTAVKNDLVNADIVDMSKTGSLTIYKYDITAADASGDYKTATYETSGVRDSRVEDALSGYGMEGIQFSYLRVGNMETHSVTGGTESFVEVVYEIPTILADILQLTAAEAVIMDGADEAYPCRNSDVYHYTSQQLNDALTAILEADDVLAKDALENYLYDYGTMDSTTDQAAKGSAANMPKTDENGYTHVEGLELGLYLVVETEVPEQIVETTNPWFASLPYTNMGEQWNYDMVCYPKNQTGNPTLDKKVRNAYSNTLTMDKNGIVNSGDDYVSDNESGSLIVYNNDTNAENTADTDDAAYVANRGGYTKDGVTAGKDGAGYSMDFAYRDTTTASAGDILDYILVSKLPHISSKATFLSEYTFIDVLSEGLTYNKDVKIAFYHTAADANANNTVNADLIWDLSSGNYAQGYADVMVTEPVSGKDKTDGSTRLTVSLTEAGLAIVNGTKGNSGTEEAIRDLDGLSDYYMVVYYTVTVNSDEAVILGDEGNENNVLLTWSRTSDGYYDVLEDRNYVYSYGLDLTKTFSDGKGDFSNVRFRLYNSTDAYYVTARKESDGIYYVTGKAADETKGTTFVPNAKDGSLLINGLEADKYQLTETATDDGYSLLKDPIMIEITATDREVIASVVGTTKMTADELGRTELYVGAVRSAAAAVDNVSASMRVYTYTKGTLADTFESANATVVIKVQNSKNFTLPLTGGNGLYAVTIIGVLAAAAGCCMIFKRKRGGSARKSAGKSRSI